jgi:hypothetical protein
MVESIEILFDDWLASFYEISIEPVRTRGLV